MTRALIRFAKRRASWEEPRAVEELQQLEFKLRDGGPDLRPSAYLLDSVDEQLIRVYAEHAHRIDPQREGLALDVMAAAEVLQSRLGDVPFQFARERHREVVLDDVGALHAFIEFVVGESKRHSVTREQVVAYAQQRMEGRDEEWWLAAAAPGAKRWLRKLATSGQPLSVQVDD